MNKCDKISIIFKFKNITCPERGSNSRPPDYETDALPTALSRHLSEQEIGGDNS